MKAVYSWSMRNGSPILFALSAILVLLALEQSFEGLRQVARGGEPYGSNPSPWLMPILGALSAFSTAVLPFIGAVAIHRFDERTHLRQAVRDDSIRRD